MRWIVPILFISWFFAAASAYESGQLQWDKGITGTLKRNDEISLMGYSVKVVAFNAPVESDRYKDVPIEPVEPFVGLNISKNGSLINITSLGQGESYISPDGDLKITAAAFPGSLAKDWLYESYNPWVKLELSPPGKPDLEIRIDTEDEYISTRNAEVVVKVTLKNTGTADAMNLDMNIGAQMFLLRGNLKNHYDLIKKGEEASETVAFSIPIVTGLKRFNLTVNASGFDIKGKSYIASMLRTIVVAPQPQQAPSLSKSTNAKAYLKDIIMVSLSLKNNADYELKNVSIVDTVPRGFRQVSNNPLVWVINVSPNGEWYFRYLLKPTQATSKGVLFPSAAAEYKISDESYVIQSNRPEITIYGPIIELTKQTDVSEIDPGGEVTVTVTAVNTGTTPSLVAIKDGLPPDVTLISGRLGLEEYLEANREVSFSYTFRSDSGEPVILPPAVAEYFELGSMGTRITAFSQELQIRIKPPLPEPIPEPTAEIPVDLTDQNATVNVTDIQQESPPGIESSPFERNAILGILMDCGNNSVVDPGMNLLSDVCSFAASVS